MALDDASPQTSSYSADNGSIGGPLPQNSILTKYFPVTIKPELVVQPDPFTLYFGFFGSRNWKREVGEALSWRVESSWMLVARAPTQEEMDAFTSISTRSLYYRRLGFPLSTFLATAYFADKARKSPHFPQRVTPANLVTAVRNFAVSDPNQFRRTAGSAVMRLIILTTTCAILSNAAGAWTDMSGMFSDPRLQQFIADAKQQKPEDVRRRQQQASIARVRSGRNNQSITEDRMQHEVDLLGGVTGASNQDRDSYGKPAPVSPSPAPSGYGGYENIYGSTDQPRPMPEASRGQSSQGVSSEQQDSPTDLFFGGSGDDDASPTAPEYRYKNPDGSPMRNSWERIRNQNAAQSRQSQVPWGRVQTPAETYDSAPPSNQDQYDQERRREKEQARAEFERMMDAERNASSDGPPRSRGWWS